MRFVAGLFLFWLCFCTAAMTEETSHLAFVSEYVRQLAVNERMRELGQRDVSEANNPSEKIMAGIRASTRIVLELKPQITRLHGMKFAAPFDTLPGSIATFYRQKVTLHERIIEMDGIFISGLSRPDPGVDYDSLVADAPKITATLEYLDRSLFESTPLIFATLIDEKPDRNGHMSRLIVSKEERAKLVRDLTTSFGKKMEAKDQNYIVSRLPSSEICCRRKVTNVLMSRRDTSTHTAPKAVSIAFLPTLPAPARC
jgi:hypothetical protein